MTDNQGSEQGSEVIPDPLRKLKTKRSTIKATLTRFRKFLDDLSTDDVKEVQLPRRLAAAEPLLDNFSEVHAQILDLDDVLNHERHISELESFEESYFEAVSRAGVLQSKVNGLADDNRSVSSSSSHSQQPDISLINSVKLPVIDLPSFSGCAEKWLPFFETFDSLINSNANLNKIQRFYYLKSCLKGDAEAVIASLEITSDNYDIAWSILKERFQNNKLIIHNHVRALFDLPAMNKESLPTLRKLLDDINKNLRVLKSFNQPVDTWDTLLIYLINTKLDPVTKRAWESANIANDSCDMSTFLKFLSKRCQLLETLKFSSEAESHVSNKHFSNKNQGTCRSLATISNKANDSQPNSKIKCFFCKEHHLIFYCDKFLALGIRARVNEIKKLKLCVNCFRTNHSIEDCLSSGCRKCGKKHNTLLHFSSTAAVEPSNTQVSTTNQKGYQHQNQASTNLEADDHVTALQCMHNHESDVLLSTAIVKILDKFGNEHQARVLLDSGSQSNFMTQELCDRLNLDKQNINIPVAGIHQNVTSAKLMTKATIKSKISCFELKTSFLVLNKITQQLPVVKVNLSDLVIPKNIRLADDSFYTPAKIDILLGAAHYYDLLCIGQINRNNDQPIIQKTKLGWVISGRIPCSSKNQNTKQSICNLSTLPIQVQLQQFWELESYAEKKKLSKEEEECEQEFIRSIAKDETGRYIVPLLFKNNIEDLGDSYETAVSRFKSLERKLNRDEKLKELYTTFMEEYINLEHMAEIKESEDHANLTYYLPHHGVLKETSSTTRLRAVFDASCKTSSGVSLNDRLKVGPTIQQELFSILIRFRKHNVVIAGDIEKMYRQVLIKREHSDLQRILWRSEPDSKLKTYRLNTVTYGTACAAYLAIRCLQQCAIECEDTYPIESNVIKSDFYVDDLLSGCDTIESAIQLKNNLQKILDKSGFHLRKWVSNKNEIFQHDQDTDFNHEISDDQTNKTLGLQWNSKSDQLEYTIRNKLSMTNKVTKRAILSTISQIFDPLGLVGPCIIKAKIILQKLWKLNLDWDESVPNNLHTMWMDFYRELHFLDQLRIPRQVTTPIIKSIQLHCFTDASEQAYGVCIYLRSTGNHGIHAIRLLCAKSRVAPVKSITLPKLELCGAVLLVGLTKKVIESLDTAFERITYWCDSTVVLSWIAAEPCQWKTFVSHRVSAIQESTNMNQWRYVNTKDNPADIISRGVNPAQLAESSLWWNAPHWLALDEDQWPTSNFKIPDKIPETKKTTVSLLVINNDFNIFDRYSSLLRLQRVIALVFRFKHNVQNKNNKLTGPITTDELNHAVFCLIKLAQQEAYPNELSRLKQNKQIKSTSNILSLSPFLDNEHILRVGGRLNNASHINYSQRHPIILSSKHILTKLIIRSEHYRLLHAGPQALLASIRTRYWPVSGKNLVKQVLRTCIVCFKTNPVSIQPLMGDLPGERVTPSRPFAHTGVDYAGPFNTKISHLRGSRSIDVYLCIFVCFSTKATHIEVVSDLTGDCFLNCLKRFIGRRGKPYKLYSDNGSNFLKANKNLKDFIDLISKSETQLQITNFLASESIIWQFIPARSPNFGGLWEAAVKAAKYHLKRVTQNVALALENFNTIVIQIEACLNSRPITPISTDPEDLQALTPGHFLIGAPVTMFPEPCLLSLPSNRLNLYQRMTQITQGFWSKWSIEYISQMQQRQRWRTSKGDVNFLKIGQLVILKDDNLPILKWRLGRIVRTYPGKDNIVRVALVKTNTGEVRRAINKICVLPIEP